MSCLNEVLKLKKKLEKLIATDTEDHDSALDMLKALKKQPMTLDVLQKTRVGMTVNNLRKAVKNDECVTLSKSLIKSWKKLLSESSSSKSDSQSSGGSLSRSSSVVSRDDEGSQDGFKSQDRDSDGKESSSSPKTYAAKASDTNDTVRLKCRDMLRNALKVTDVDGKDYDELAASIEECIFEEFSSTEMKYKNRIRSRVSNLKDPKNEDLRMNVLTGRIPPDRIAVMTAEEMATDEMKNMRAKYTKEGIDNHQMAKTTGTSTDLLKCGKCGKRNCTYNQVQTRSADEPMTTFVLCNECGNRWKFC